VTDETVYQEILSRTLLPAGQRHSAVPGVCVRTQDEAQPVGRDLAGPRAAADPAGEGPTLLVWVRRSAVESPRRWCSSRASRPVAGRRSGRTGTPVVAHRVSPRHQHAWSEWAQAGISDTTQRRDCRECGRIQTRLRKPPGRR